MFWVMKGVKKAMRKFCSNQPTTSEEKDRRTQIQLDATANEACFCLVRAGKVSPVTNPSASHVPHIKEKKRTDPDTRCPRTSITKDEQSRSNNQKSPSTLLSRIMRNSD